MLDTVHLDHPSLKIQPRLILPRPKKRKNRLNGYCLPALRAITGARGYLTGTFPTLAVAAASCGSHKDSIGAAVVILKAEDGALLADVLAGRKPLLATAKSMTSAVSLIDAFRKASNVERKIFARVITPETLFEVVAAAL